MVGVAFLVDFIAVGFFFYSFAIYSAGILVIVIPLVACFVVTRPEDVGQRDTTGSFELAFQIFLGVYAASCVLVALLRLPQASSGRQAGLA